MKRAKFDNPWLVPTLFTFLPFCGFCFGFMLGPIFTPGAAKLPDSDPYAWGLYPNVLWATIGLIGGIILAAIIIFQLNRQKDIVIPDERFGHSEDPFVEDSGHHH